MTKNIFLLFLLVISSVSTCYLPINQLAHLYTCMSHNYKHLSILHGALAYESRALQDIYNSSDTTATKKTIKALFHQDRLQFAPTVAANNPVTYLTIEDIAVVINWLEDIHKQITISNYALPALIYSGDYKTPALKELETSLLKKAKASAGEQFNAKSFRGHYNTVLKNLCFSVGECKEQIYPEYTTHALLLALLFYKAQSKKDILLYLQTLNNYLPVLRPDAIGHEQLWNNYSLSDYTNITTILNTCSIKTLKKDTQFYQYINTALIAHGNYLQDFPPRLAGGYYGYQNNSIVPDCMETVLREFCNALLYNPVTHKFDLELYSDLTLSKNFKIFYTQHCDPTQVQSAAVGQAWMNLVSGLEHIEYVRNRYEIRPTIANFLAIMSEFFTYKFTNIDQLTKLLSSSEKREISCVVGNEKTPDGIAAVLTFVITNKLDSKVKKYTISLYLLPDPQVWHAWCIVPERDLQKSQNLLACNSKLIEQLDKLKDATFETQSLMKLLNHEHL